MEIIQPDSRGGVHNPEKPIMPPHPQASEARAIVLAAGQHAVDIPTRTMRGPGQTCRVLPETLDKRPEIAVKGGQPLVPEEDLAAQAVKESSEDSPFGPPVKVRK